MEKLEKESFAELDEGRLRRFDEEAARVFYCERAAKSRAESKSLGGEDKIVKAW